MHAKVPWNNLDTQHPRRTLDWVDCNHQKKNHWLLHWDNLAALTTAGQKHQDLVHIFLSSLLCVPLILSLSPFWGLGCGWLLQSWRVEMGGTPSCTVMLHVEDRGSMPKIYSSPGKQVDARRERKAVSQSGGLIQVFLPQLPKLSGWKVVNDWV